jgi:hypothetical protein
MLNTRWSGIMCPHLGTVWNCELWHMSVQECGSDTLDREVDTNSLQWSSGRVFVFHELWSRVLQGVDVPMLMTST